MLRVTLGEDNVEIRFDHKFYTPNEIEGLTGICVDEDRRCSLAEVSVNGELISVGVAVCHPKDNFCRAIGRKKALVYGVYTLSKELRTAVWAEYEAVCGF